MKRVPVKAVPCNMAAVRSKRNTWIFVNSSAGKYNKVTSAIQPEKKRVVRNKMESRKK